MILGFWKRFIVFFIKLEELIAYNNKKTY